MTQPRRPLSRWSLSAALTTLVTLSLLTSYGCCSTPTLPTSLMPPEDLKIDQGVWDVNTSTMTVTLPFKDLRKVLANRKRWIGFAKGNSTKE